MTVKELPNNMIEVRPDEGRMLTDKRSGKHYSVAVVKKSDGKWFEEE